MEWMFTQGGMEGGGVTPPRDKGKGWVGGGGQFTPAKKGGGGGAVHPT